MHTLNEIIAAQTIRPKQNASLLGHILIGEKLISGTQLEHALSIQAEERSLPLGEILVRMGFINREILLMTLTELQKTKLIGDLLLDLGFISEVQLIKALDRQNHSYKPLGEILLIEGYLDKEALAKGLVVQQNKPKLGQILLQKMLIEPHNLQKALDSQNKGRKLGAILVELQFLSPRELNTILDRYKKREPLDVTLLGEGLISMNALEKARFDAAREGKDPVRLLLSHGELDERKLLKAQAARFEIPFKPLERITYPPQDKLALIDLIGPNFARKNRIIPIKISGNTVTIAITDPQNLKAVENLSSLHASHTFEACLVVSQDFEEAFSLLYCSSQIETKTEKPYVELIYSTEDNHADRSSGRHYEAVRLVDLLFERAIELKATDIHLETDSSGVHVRYRVDGILRSLENFKILNDISANILPVISRLKMLGGMDLAERRLPQDGAFRLDYRLSPMNEIQSIDVRISTIKTHGLTENMAIRILDPRQTGMPLEDLNYSASDLMTIKSLLNSPSGLFLVTGPTGSGKTTTLYACLQYLKHPGIKIMASENPVEYIIPGITQVNINPKIGLSHANALKSFLRQDPEVILLGEILDEETAQVAVKAAETGHLILSTLHTSDPIAAILRLIDLGVSRDTLASTLIGIISQRLVPFNCEACAEQYVPPRSEWSQLFTEYPLSRPFFKSKGCEECGSLGFNGRKPIYEFLLIDRDIQRMLRHKRDMAVIREEALRKGMKSMVEHALSEPKDFNLSELLKMQPYHLIDEFKTNHQEPEKKQSK